MRFLYLTTEEGRKVAVNSDHIKYFEPAKLHPGTVLWFDGVDDWMNVQETSDSVYSFTRYQE